MYKWLIFACCFAAALGASCSAYANDCWNCNMASGCNWMSCNGGAPACMVFMSAPSSCSFASCPINSGNSGSGSGSNSGNSGSIGNSGMSGTNWPTDSSSGEKKSGAPMFAAFTVLYAICLVLVVILYYVRKSAFRPVLESHLKRNDIMDFSALVDERIGSAVLNLNEQVIWCDVSLRVPTFMSVVIPVVFLVFGFIVLIVVTKVIPGVAFLAIFFLFCMIPSFIEFGNAFKQLVQKQHYTHLNALTEKGAHIVNIHGGCGGQANVFYPYNYMWNIHNVNTPGTDGHVGTVFFAEKWEKENVTRTHHHNGRAHTYNSKEWKKKGVGFTNIINTSHVQSLIVARLPQDHHHHTITTVVQPVVAAAFVGSPYMPQPGYPQQGYPPQGYPQQGYPQQGGYSSPTL